MVALGIARRSGEILRIKEDRTKLIREWPVPTSPEEVSSYLGAGGATRHWVKNFAEISRPLSRLVLMIK